MEVVDGAAGGEQERVVLAGRLVRRDVVAGLQDGAPFRVQLRVVLPLVRRTCEEIVAVVLGVVGARVEAVIGVEALRPPLDAAAAAEPLVREIRVVARTAARHLLEGVEALLGRPPLDERRSVLVLEPEPRRVVEEDLHVGSRLPRRLDGPLGGCTVRSWLVYVPVFSPQR